MGYLEAAWERAMKIQEVILRALSGEIHWFQAAEILGLSTRTMRRYRAGLDKWGYEGLFDRRRRTPSPRNVTVVEVKRILGLYRERYRGWNVRHFYQTVTREHGVKVSYTFVKQALRVRDDLGPSSAHAADAALTPEAREQLKALGYIQDGVEPAAQPTNQPARR